MDPLIEQVRVEVGYLGYSECTEKSYCEHLLKLSRYINSNKQDTHFYLFVFHSLPIFYLSEKA